jgi:hypothetical protein
MKDVVIADTQSGRFGINNVKSASLRADGCIVLILEDDTSHMYDYTNWRTRMKISTGDFATNNSLDTEPVHATTITQSNGQRIEIVENGPHILNIF